MSPVTGAPAKKTSKTSAAVAPKKGKKKIAAAPLKSKSESKKLVNPLFEKRPKNFGIGQGKKKSPLKTSIENLNEFLRQIFNTNEIYHVSSNGLITFVFNVNVRFC